MQQAPPLQQSSAEFEIALELPMNASDATARRISFMLRTSRRSWNMSTAEFRYRGLRS